jgi:hypothetical protein
MACCISKDPPGGQDFGAPIGRTVTLTVEGPAHVDVEVLHIRYAGIFVDNQAPFQFTVVEGARTLVVLVEASLAGAELRLIEVCDDGSLPVLRTFIFDPSSPARGYRILGS